MGPTTARDKQFHTLLSADRLDYAALQKLSWKGVPDMYRSAVWPLLLGYWPIHKDRKETCVVRKRQEYNECVRQYYHIPDEERGSQEQKTLRQVRKILIKNSIKLGLLKMRNIRY